MADVITRPSITKVELTPNPIAVGKVYNIAITVVEEEYIAVVNPMFEFSFSNESLTGNLLGMGEITYEKRN